MTEQPYRVFVAEVHHVRRLSPSFVRVTFVGPELHAFSDTGYDQRIKLVFGRHGSVPTGPEWYSWWRAQPDESRPPIRTYTARAVRPQLREVDVDLVLHGDAGPASRFAATAAPGDVLALVGPNAAYDGDCGGVEFRPPHGVTTVLLGGDETAVPAAMSIVERLPADVRGEVLLEVPDRADALDVRAPAAVRVAWLAREGADHGSRLVPAVVAAADRLLPSVEQPVDAGDGPVDVDVDREILWEVPDPGSATGLYAWLAGEAGVIRTLRRHLLVERGLDRATAAFMGYWRKGRTEPN